jgi:predicted permease
MLPLDGGGMGLGGIVVEGRPASPERRSWGPDWNVVTPGYFTTIGIAIVKGRDFTDADRAGTPHVAILNETFAENLYPGVDPIGRTFQNGDLTVTVVGVARNGKYRTLGESPRNFVYVAMAQRYIPRTMLLVKTEGGAQVATPLRQLVARLDRSLPILYQRSLVEHAATSLFPQRIALLVAGSLGGVALLLALLGIYGVTAFSVTQRTREIGVRMALGSQRGQVLALILRQGVRLAIIGVAIGAMVGFAVTRLLGALLYGVPATDAAAFVGAAVLLSSAAVIASWLPARRAAGIDPVIALRAE